MKGKFLKGTICALVLALFSVAGSVNAAVQFKDLKNHWAEKVIAWGVENNIIKGYPDGTFKPSRNVTEAQFIAMLVRYFHPEVKDNPNGHWAENYYQIAKQLNYPLKGYNNLALRDKPITRTQVAEILSSAEGVHYNGNDAIRYLLAYKLARGTDPNNVTVANFKGDQSLTRAQAVQFLYNFMSNGIFEELRPRPTTPSDPLLIPFFDFH